MKIVSIVLICFTSVVMYAQSANDLSGKVGFVSLTTAQDTQEGAPQKFAPKVLLRFRGAGNSSVLAMTDDTGTALIPIEAGKYCATAYGLNGKTAKLSAKSSESFHRCFTAVAGKVIEFSLTLAADATYAGKIPALGVN